MAENLAEQSVLGTMLEHNYLINESGIVLDHFESGVHKNIYSRLMEVYQEKRSVDVITLLTVADPQEVGGANYLTQLAAMSNESKFETHVSVVLDSWKERKKRNVLQLALNENWTNEKVSTALSEIAVNKSSDLKSVFTLCTEIADKPWEKVIVQKGAPTGIDALDEMIGGLQKAELAIIAGRPSMGKTDILLKFATAAGATKKYIPTLFSLEMPAEKLNDRLIASYAGYNRIKMRDPYNLMDDKQKEKWYPAVGYVSELGIVIHDDAGQKVSEIKAKSRRIQKENPEKELVILIDYLTLIKSDDSSLNNNMHLKVGSITKALKAMAKELNCPVVVLSQLSREVEKRQDKRPMMSDLRESGSIEEDADLIAFIYRDSYYNPVNNPLVDLDIIVAKQRNGPTGTVTTEYNKYTGDVKHAKREAIVN